MLKFHRIAICSPDVHPGDICHNASQIIKFYKSAVEEGAAVIVTPELSLTGYSCGDLFLLDNFLSQARAELDKLAKATRGKTTILLVGLPLAVGTKIYNVTAVIQGGFIQGFVGKTVLENYIGAQESRRFSSIEESEIEEIEYNDCLIPCSNGLIFDAGNGLIFGCEIGADAEAPVSPSVTMTQSGAVAIFHGTAQIDEATCNYPLATAESLSQRLQCAYFSVGANCSESTCHGVFDGRLFSSVCGNSSWQGEGSLFFTDINCNWIQYQRRRSAAFRKESSLQVESIISLAHAPTIQQPTFADISPRPFEEKYLPSEIISLQAKALAHRVETTNCQRMVIGISGGLDSTLALLAAAACCDLLRKSRKFILAVTMPGLGTTSRTKGNAEKLVNGLGAELREISIKKSVMQHFKDIGHDPAVTDVTYENAQARERTQILMDLANQEKGLVIGTGDMSEIALGWSTFNGDHMSMYCINAGVPKTLIRAVICDYADNLLDNEKSSAKNSALAAVLDDIVETPVSPELLPGGSDTQKTEGILGSYDLHDFYLYHFLKYGESPENILELAKFAFEGEFKDTEIKRTVDLFFKRFFTQQFKRNAAPEGPKIIDLDLNASAGWIMPSDLNSKF